MVKRFDIEDNRPDIYVNSTYRVANFEEPIIEIVEGGSSAGPRARASSYG